MEIAVVIPTLNERDNIGPLLNGILSTDNRLQAIVVDDGSVDGTGDAVTRLAAEYAARSADGETRIHLIARGRKLGYASAVQDGMRFALKSGARLVLQMDADFSHDPKYLPQILERSAECDLVIGSRYVPGGGTQNWGIDRTVLSGGANALART
ncbi:MAG TPA: glycosyltransferase, partial [Abditibacteriaceae bacterium]